MADTLKRLLLGLAVSSVLAACTAPAYRVPQISQPLPQAYKEQGPWTPAEAGDLAGRAEWWTQFGDASLNALQQQLLADNPTLAQALARYEHSPDTFLAARGQSMSSTFARYAQLSAALEEIRGAGPVQRLRLLPAFLDTDVGERTLADFKPAVPVTMEGFLYAAAGIFIGYFLFSALFSLLMLPFRWLVRPRRWRITE